MNYKERYEAWLKDDYFDEEFINELKSLQGYEKEIEDRFFKDLEFGTGGMRGVIGAGTNRMNEYVIRKASQGFVNFALKRYKENSIVIAYDCRHKSPEFALETALVFAANGIKAYLFESLRSTPELSFAVRTLNASVGVVVTASHNPPEYNGFKIYGDDGCQLLPEDADKVVEEVSNIKSFSEVKYITKEEAIEKGLLEYIKEEQDNLYLDMVQSVSIDPNIIKEMRDEVKVVYTALHGAGARPIELIMKRQGLKNFYPVAEQMIPDPDFRTLASPNPEDLSAFEMGIELAIEKDADVVIATDPDCDRVGVVVKNSEDEYVALNGNQTGVLLVDYILGNIEEIPDNAIMVNTIVTSGMAEKIINSYGVELVSTLTGFKFIGEKIKEYEDGSKTFLFGYEESYGYLAGTHVRDKDAVIATMLIVEMVAKYKKDGLTLVDVLEALYDKFGYYQESLASIKLEGKDGLDKIGRIMDSLRANPFKEVLGVKVKSIMDCLDQTITDENGKKDNGLPKANVLKFYLEDGSWFAARPSGTEPKIKFYFSVAGITNEDCLEKLNGIEEFVLERVDSVK